MTDLRLFLTSGVLSIALVGCAVLWPHQARSPAHAQPDSVAEPPPAALPPSSPALAPSSPALPPPTAAASPPPVIASPPPAVAASPAAVPVRPAVSAVKPKIGPAAAKPLPAVAPPAKTPQPSLDLASLEQRLRDTHAIGVFTKLSLKNQVDDLLGQFREFHHGAERTPPPALRNQYDLLMLKVLSLLQDSDPPLAMAIASSREAIWGILKDPDKFSKI